MQSIREEGFSPTSNGVELTIDIDLVPSPVVLGFFFDIRDRQHTFLVAGSF